MKLVLAISGGGIRGILPARLLQAMQESGVYHAFDLIAGTSTGGIIASGLCSGVTPKTLVDFYVNHGGEVFHHDPLDGIVTAKYHPDNLERLLKQVLGSKRLSDCEPHLLVPSYCIDLEPAQDTDGDGIPECAASWFFKSYTSAGESIAGSKYDIPLWEVARATSAAPTYFPAFTVPGLGNFVDGGVFANNPGLCALADAYRMWPGEQIKVLSLGTGSKVKAIKGINWGGVEWVPNIASVFMDGAADSTSYILQTALEKDFLRCEIALHGVNDAFDDASPQNIEDLQALANDFVAAHLPRVKTFLEAN